MMKISSDKDIRNKKIEHYSKFKDYRSISAAFHYNKD